MAREGIIASVITQAIQSFTGQILSALIILNMIEWMKWGNIWLTIKTKLASARNKFTTLMQRLKLHRSGQVATKLKNLSLILASSTLT